MSITKILYGDQTNRPRCCSLNVQNSIRFCIHWATQDAKQTFDHGKVKCCVRKANLPWNFAIKIEATTGFKRAKKIIKKKRALSPPPPIKKIFGLGIPKKHSESTSTETKFRFLSTSATQQTWALDWTWIGLDPDYNDFCWFWIGSGLQNAS